MDEWIYTLGAVARSAELCDATIREYERLGLLHCRRDSTGRRLFRADAPAEARRIFEERKRPRILKADRLRVA